MVAFSPRLNSDLSRLRGFLYERMYKHYRLNRTRAYAKRILRDMFDQFRHQPDTLPPQWLEALLDQETENDRARMICDYIAGMTDAFAMQEHRALFGIGSIEL